MTDDAPLVVGRLVGARRRGPWLVPHSAAIAARLLSATACMKSCTAAEAVLAGLHLGGAPPAAAARGEHQGCRKPPSLDHECLVGRV